MQNNFKKYVDIALVLLWAAVIFGFSSVPSLNSGLETDYILRKISHMLEFGFLAFLVWRLLKSQVASRIGAIILAGLCSVVYAITDEIHQLFVTGRSGNLKDVGIDVIGILIFSFVIFIFSRSKFFPYQKSRL